MSDRYSSGFDRLGTAQEGREISLVFRDYGNFYNSEHGKIESGAYPGLGNLYYIKDPIHLLCIAMNLSRFAELKTVDLPQVLAFGWTTGLTTVLIKVRDLRDSCLRYQKGEQEKDETGLPVRRPVASLVEQANVIADSGFRKRFCNDWPMMVREYPFIRVQEDL
jgi:hypothetical protein